MEMNRRDVSLSGVAMTAVTLAGQGSAEAAPAAPAPRLHQRPHSFVCDLQNDYRKNT